MAQKSPHRAQAAHNQPKPQSKNNDIRTKTRPLDRQGKPAMGVEPTSAFSRKSFNPSRNGNRGSADSLYPGLIRVPNAAISPLHGAKRPATSNRQHLVFPVVSLTSTCGGRIIPTKTAASRRVSKMRLGPVLGDPHRPFQAVWSNEVRLQAGNWLSADCESLD